MLEKCPQNVTAGWNDSGDSSGKRVLIGYLNTLGIEIKLHEGTSELFLDFMTVSFSRRAGISIANTPLSLNVSAFSCLGKRIISQLAVQSLGFGVFSLLPSARSSIPAIYKRCRIRASVEARKQSLANIG
jgi:hypothetical protein